MEKKLDDFEKVGNKLDDFEILQNLGKETKNLLITKVKSKKDNKIYCMRKVKIWNLMNIDKDIENVKKTIGQLDHPHIIKYYNAFKEDKNQYICIIMEYIETDIKNFIEIYKITDQNVPEETIAFLLIQCLSALKYLYSKTLEPKVFRLSNILMPNERSLKIGIIKDSFPEEWEQKDDINLIYKYFQLMMFPESFKFGQGIKAYLSIKRSKIFYEKILREIIDDMAETKKIDKRFDKIIQFYIDKYELKKNNSIIKTTIDCLSENFQLNESLNDISEEERKKYYMVNLYNNINKKNEKYYYFIVELKGFIALDYPSFDNEIELNPYYVIDFILVKMEPFILKKNGQDKKIIISELFSILEKVDKTCKKCKKIHSSYQKENIVIFNLNENNEEDFEIIKDGFINNNKNLKREKYFCKKCFSYQEYEENITYHNFSDYLIIYFNRGNNFENKRKVLIEKEIDVTNIINIENDNLVRENNTKNIYYFVGGINVKNENGNFIFEKINKYEKNSENIIILFYKKH